MDGTSERHRSTATVGLALLVAACAPAPPTSTGEPPPNIVIITADDLGYGDLASYGPIDGVDLSPVLFGEGPSPREAMSYYRMGELYAFRQGRYKVHFVTEGRYGLPPLRTDHDPPLMFDLDEDPAERFDVAAQRPEALAAIVAAAERHRANMTVAEPLFDLRGGS